MRYDTDRDLQVFHYTHGGKFTAWELVTKHGYVVEMDGSTAAGFALALRDSAGIGLYIQPGTFRTARDAKAASFNALSVAPVKGLRYINR